MIHVLVELGDRVIIKTEKSCNQVYPRGTIATVIGFSESYRGRIHNFGSKPGVYVNKMWVTIRLENGFKDTKSSGDIELINKAEYARRVTAFEKLQQEQSNNWSENEFLRELPETPFWEGDFVCVPKQDTSMIVICTETPPQDPLEIFQINRIDYLHTNEPNYPAYEISDRLGSGWHTSATADDIALLERGPVWKYYHGETITFNSIEEEAKFFDLLGHDDEVRNPINGKYLWTKKEVLDAIRKGFAHGFSISDSIGTGTPRITALHFRDEELGRRVAQATLQGFKMT